MISPTISSRMSSIVTRPAVPPYSSMTIAMWVRWLCISRSSSSTGFDSGTQTGGRATSSTLVARARVDVLRTARQVLEVHDADDVVERSRRRPGCGRSRCAAPARAPAGTVLVRSIQTISVRGTITSRAMVSPSSNTDWIICRSPCSTTPRSSAMSTSSRSSTSEENGPSRNPRPGVIALPNRVSSEASGPNTRPSTRTAPAPASATAVRVLAAERAGPDADDGVGDDHHDDDGQGRHRPAGAELRPGDDRRQHRGGQLARDPQQQQQVRVAGSVGDDLAQRAGTAASLAQELLDPGNRHPGERGVDAGEQATERDQADRDDQRDDVARWSPTHRPMFGGSATPAARDVADLAAGARQRRPDRRRGRSPSTQSASSRACSSNIIALLLRVAVVVAQQVQDAVRAEQVQLGLDGVAGRAAWSAATTGQSTTSPSIASARRVGRRWAARTGRTGRPARPRRPSGTP